MLKTIKQELYRLVHSLPLLLILLAAAILSIIPGGGTVWRQMGVVGVDDPLYQLKSENEFVNYFEGYHLSMEAAKNMLKLEDSPAETFEALYLETNPYAYVRILWYMGGMAFLLIVLPTVLFGTGKKNGVTETAARLGGSYKRVTAAKLLIGYVFALVVSVIGVLLQTDFYAPYVGGLLGTGYCLRCVFQRAVLDASLLSLPFFVAAKMKRPAAATAVNVGITVIYFIMNLLGASVPQTPFLPVPPLLHGMRGLWTADASPLLTVLSLVTALVWMAVFGWLSTRTGGKAKR